MAISCSAKAAKRSGLTQALGQLEILVRFVVLTMLLATLGCSNPLSQQECMELMEKEVGLIETTTPEGPDKLRTLGKTVIQGCPSNRSRKDYECMMAANNAGQYAACKG